MNDVFDMKDYVLKECERQWNEVQAQEGMGAWEEQADDIKADFYNSMYLHLTNNNNQ